MALNLQLFGGPRIHSEDGTDVKLPTKRSAGLLAYLADHCGDLISRERIAELFWPRRQPEQARASLRQELAVLRKALAPFDADSIYADRKVVAYTNRETFIDSQQFRAIADTDEDLEIDQKMRALALYRQPLLKDLSIRSQPFEDWVWSRDQVYQQSALSLGLQALHHWRDAGMVDKVIQVARRLIDIEPCHEAAHKILTEAYWQNGHTSLALRQFQACQDAVQRMMEKAPA